GGGALQGGGGIPSPARSQAVGDARTTGRGTFQKKPNSSRAASVMRSGVQGGDMTSRTFALLTPSIFSSAETAFRRISGPAGQAGDVRVISTSISVSRDWIE